MSRGGSGCSSPFSSDYASSVIEMVCPRFVPVIFPEFSWFQDFNFTIRNTRSTSNATRAHSKQPSLSETEYEIARVRGDALVRCSPRCKQRVVQPPPAISRSSEADIQNSPSLLATHYGIDPSVTASSTSTLLKSSRERGLASATFQLATRSPSSSARSPPRPNRQTR